MLKRLATVWSLLIQVLGVKGVVQSLNTWTYDTHNLCLEYSATLKHTFKKSARKLSDVLQASYSFNYPYQQGNIVKGDPNYFS